MEEVIKMKHFGKNCNIQGKWLFITLNEEEIAEAFGELIQINKNQAEICIERLKEMPADVSKLIIEKQLIASYTYFSQKIDSKVSDMRNKPISERPAFKKAEETVEKELGGNQEVVLGKSAIAEAFEKAEE